MGSARTKMDGSSCCVTCFHINPIILRWATRSAYNIPGSDTEDLCYGLFCPCCVINQVAQTTSQYGRPYAEVGPEYNRYPAAVQQNTECIENCCYTTFCLPCAIGTTLQLSMGMPFWMGCCCSNLCISRNLVRYHYRLNGSDIGEDCILPYGTCCLSCVLSLWIPCLMCCSCPLFIGMVMNTLNEAKTKGNIDPKSPNGTYLRAPARPAIFNTNPVGPTAIPAGAIYAQQQQPAATYAYVQQPATYTYAQQPAVQQPGIHPAGMQPYATANGVVYQHQQQQQQPTQAYYAPVAAVAAPSAPSAPGVIYATQQQPPMAVATAYEPAPGDINKN